MYWLWLARRRCSCSRRAQVLDESSRGQHSDKVQPLFVLWLRRLIGPRLRVKVGLGAGESASSPELKRVPLGSHCTQRAQVAKVHMRCNTRTPTRGQSAPAPLFLVRPRSISSLLLHFCFPFPLQCTSAPLGQRSHLDLSCGRRARLLAGRQVKIPAQEQARAHNEQAPSGRLRKPFNSLSERAQRS